MSASLYFTSPNSSRGVVIEALGREGGEDFARLRSAGSQIQEPPLAGRQAFERVIPQPGAVQGLNVPALAGEHAAHLMVTAFG